jgi:hypothetical protein
VKIKSVWLAAIFFVSIAAPVQSNELPASSGIMVSKSFLSGALENVAPAKLDEKGEKMKERGYAALYVPIVLVFSAEGSLIQAHNGPMDQFYANPREAGKLGVPLENARSELLKLTDITIKEELSEKSDKLLVMIVSPPMMRDVCAPCGEAPEKVAEVLRRENIAAKVVLADMSM